MQHNLFHQDVCKTASDRTLRTPRGENVIDAPNGRRQRRFRKIAAVAAGVVCLLLASVFRPASAKIFLRWDRGDAAAILSGHQAGKTLYQSPARMNGVRGNAGVAHYEIDFNTLRADIIAQKKAGTLDTPDTIWRIGTRHILGTPTANQNGERTLFFDLAGHGGVLCIRFQPSDRHATPAGNRLPAGMPAYPGAAIQWSMELDRSRLTMYSATANAHAATVAASFDRSLRHDGWQDAIGTSPDIAAKPSGSRFYLKNGAMLIFQTGPARAPGGAATHLTVVHKKR